MEREWRAHIAHLQVVHPKDIGRLKELNVTANFQALWAAPDDDNLNLGLAKLGKERFNWQYPIQSIVKSGARLAFGSDWYKSIS